MMLRVIQFTLLAVLALPSLAFDNSRFDNVAVYWGQNSYGAANSGDPANFQKRLSFYCNDNAIDVFPVAFLNVFFGPGGVPSINLANTCNGADNSTFPGTSLADCRGLQDDIKACQSKGKIVTLSLGGATGAVGFQTDAQASTFAQQVWDMFLGGSSSIRPFGNAILDGVDLDIEGGGSAHYDVFVNKILALAAPTSRKYYITAAPQCVFPDAALQQVLDAAWFDAVYVQFYNNPCGLQAFGQNWNFGIWDHWARFTSVNKNVKVYIGAPASRTAAGSGYVPIDNLKSIAVQTRNSFPSFGGIMMWDASQAYANGRYDLSIKQALVAAGGTGFTYPACSAPAYVSGTGYTGGAQVSYQGYIWQAKWFASSAPAHTPSGEWSAISACGGTAVPPTTTTTTRTTTSSTTTRTTTSTTASPTTTTTRTTTTTTTTPPATTSTTSTAPVPTTTGGTNSCAGVEAWTNSKAYQGGDKVVYNNHLWTARWWSQADTPGGLAGVWIDNGPCGARVAGSDSRQSEAGGHLQLQEAGWAAPTVSSRFFRN